MRLPALLSFLGFVALSAYGADAPAGVDALAPADVAKAVSALKDNFVHTDTLSDAELQKATLQGLLDRLAPAVSLVSGTAQSSPATPFYSEAYGDASGYILLGDLTSVNIQKAKDALAEWSGKQVASIILDLRATPASSNFDAAADLARLFAPKSTPLFTLKSARPSTSSTTAQEHIYTADSAPIFKGLLVVIVDGQTAEASEAVAASLRASAKALLVGDKTAGQAFQFTEYPLGGATLRVAVAQVIMGNGKELGATGVTPDIPVALGSAKKQDFIASIGSKGIVSVTAEHDRPHLNEVALVAKSNPEIDEIEAEQASKKKPEAVLDRQLQRSLDLVTSISVYQAKPAATPIPSDSAK